ncbi:MAG: hypothetical protein ABI423_02395 [Burkholderiales bacterium]
MPFLIATLAALLLAAASLVVVSVVGWPPEQAVAAVPPAAAAAGPAVVRAKAKCTGCGFVESVRRVAGRRDAPETYEITVRLRDGSAHSYTEAAPTQWRRGQRVVFIAGERQSGK